MGKPPLRSGFTPVTSLESFQAPRQCSSDETVGPPAPTICGCKQGNGNKHNCFHDVSVPTKPRIVVVGPYLLIGTLCSNVYISPLPVCLPRIVGVGGNQPSRLWSIAGAPEIGLAPENNAELKSTLHIVLLFAWSSLFRPAESHFYFYRRLQPTAVPARTDSFKP